MMELFAKIGNDWNPLAILSKRSILDVWNVISNLINSFMASKAKHINYGGLSVNQ